MIVLVQHISQSGAAFFEENTFGSQVIDNILKLIENPIIVRKKYADAFDETSLDEILKNNNILEITIAGMITQNCVLFTAISEKSKKYKVSILSKCCTSISPIINAVAIRGFSRIEKIMVI